MLTLVYYAMLGLSCLVALMNWRQGVYFAILLDFLRDPIRKLDPDESVIITVSVLGLWGVITLAACRQSKDVIQEFLEYHPKLYDAF